MPPPPIPGNDQITPLRRMAQLVEEGKAQRNCVATYGRRVARREAYVYRVMGPERATLAIAPDSDGKWRAEQIALKRNKGVSKKTRLAVAQWLNSHPRSTKFMPVG